MAVEETRRSLGSLKTQNEVLLELAMALRHPEPDFAQGLKQITEATARYLAVARASVWFFSEDQSRLDCVDVCEEGTHVVSEPLFASKHPAYFAACASSRVIDAADAATDPRTAEFAAEYLTPLGISAMLDGPIFSGDTPRGVVCAEHVGRPREWTEDEKAFISSVADLVALALVTRERTEALAQITSLLEIAPVGVLVLDDQGVIVRVNARSKELFDCDGTWLRGRSVETVLPGTLAPERGLLTRALLGDVGPRGAAEEHVLSGLGRSGREFSVSLSLAPIEQAGDHFLVVLINDVSERVEMERRLRASEALYRGVVEDHTGFILRAQAGGAVEFANRSLIEFMGLDPDTVKQHNIYEFTPEDQQSVVRDAIASIRPEQPVVSYNHEVVRGDGYKAQVEWVVRAFFDGGEAVTGYQAIGRDVTLERAQQIRLREAERLESLAVLSGGIAHDFNNLLTPILAYTDMTIAALGEGSPQVEDLRNVMSAAERASDLVKQLLVFSRRDRGEDRKPLLASPFIRETMAFVRASAPANVKVQSQVDSYCGVVRANPSDIFQILSNLGANAIQAMPAGGEITVVASEVNREDVDWVQIIVTDNGPGIAEEDQRHVFDPYWSSKPEGQGTGLGLSVVRGLVEELNGQIDLSSSAGQGTSFVILLPSENVAVEESVSLDRSKVFSGTENLLIVDDDAAIATLLGEGLEKLGYSVTVRSSANEALAAIGRDSDTFDALISDYTMPYMSGIELAFRCRQDCPGLPVLLISGFGQLLTEEELARGGINGCVQKPFRIDEVARALRQLLDSPQTDS
ncbi:MAG: ATP-binding protein [Pseudomonadota bacterium]